MTRYLRCDQCLGCDTQSISMTFSNTNGSTCYPWGSSLAPPCVGQGVEFPRTWDVGILDRNLKSLETRYSWLLLSLHFAYPISRFFQSCTNQQHLMFLLASLIIHYTECFIPRHQPSSNRQGSPTQSLQILASSIAIYGHLDATGLLKEVRQRWWFGKTVGCNGSTDLWLFFSEPGVRTNMYE